MWQKMFCGDHGCPVPVSHIRRPAGRGVSHNSWASPEQHSIPAGRRRRCLHSHFGGHHSRHSLRGATKPTESNIYQREHCTGLMGHCTGLMGRCTGLMAHCPGLMAHWV
ncbi:unnamed protein product [Lymnaea stagnalis]|uniref:Uncharacterized protein n=1 Tax=Lymnaea stagnalis TaxID=6523 RepID=A0AAV2H5C6_LYMST